MGRRRGRRVDRIVIENMGREREKRLKSRGREI
jgi:hypothetical protein